MPGNWHCQKLGPTHSRHSAHIPEHRSQEDKTLGSTPLADRVTESQQGPDMSLPTAPINAPAPTPHPTQLIWLELLTSTLLPQKRGDLAINTNTGELWGPRSLRRALVRL